MSSSSSSSCSKSVSPRSSLSDLPKTAFSSLPVDLIFNIFSRLPIISLCKFKSVSKLWLSIITDPFFISTHKKRALRNPNFLLLERNPIIENSEFDDKYEIKMLSLGLDGIPTPRFEVIVDEKVELLSSKWEIVCFMGESGFYVCNPSIQLFVKLPEPSCCPCRDLIAGMGYFEETNEYVLIHLFENSVDFNGDSDYGCEIMRFKDGFLVSDCSWEVVDATSPFMLRSWGILVENVFYWMIWDAYADPSDEAILSFDLNSKEFGTVSPPEGCFDPTNSWYLVELNGSLCLVDDDAEPARIEIWVLKDCLKHEWVKQYSIDLTGINSCFMCFTPLDQINGEIVMNSEHQSLDFYDLISKSFKRSLNLVEGGWIWLRIYTESFFSLSKV